MRMNPFISLVVFWTMTIEWFKENAAEKRLGLGIKFLHPGLLGLWNTKSWLGGMETRKETLELGK